MRRTQITLTDAQYARLRDESTRSGLSLAELIRRALDERYDAPSETERRRMLDAAFGGWAAQREDGAEYVERLRSGSARRLRDSA